MKRNRSLPVESPEERASAPPPVSDESTPSAELAPFAIVGVGASAGGLEAFTQLLEQLPPDSGMAFVLIQHLDPTHESVLSEALGRATRMTVVQAQAETRVEPDHVYVIPPNADLGISAGRLTLSQRADDARRPHMPIDAFFRSLARERGSRAVGVVLSGTATDGTLGLQAIRAEGGITFAQDPRTAKFDGMPSSAVESGAVDCCLPIPALAAELARLSADSYLGPAPERAADDPALGEIFAAVRRVSGIDLGAYKRPTIERRLARRMAIRKAGSFAAYRSLLQEEPGEIPSLCEDIFIHVTSFFRDPEVFETLRSHVLPRILAAKGDGAPVRIWSAGCSTGEEAYSLAITLLELIGESRRPIQIFGSDISEKAIEAARAGVYTDAALAEMPERRRRWFTKVDRGYRISRTVRDLCVFVQHDLARDPPFSRLDLVSCRNVLIYFDQPLQKRVIPTFHYALNQSGFLLLGRSENISGWSQLFSKTDNADKVFTRTAAPSALRFAPRAEVQTMVRDGKASGARSPVDATRRAVDVGRHLDRVLLDRYAPPGVLVNERMDILEYRGHTGSYLQSPPGTPQSSLLRMAREGLAAPLRAAIGRAKEAMAPVRTEGVEVDQDGIEGRCDIVVIPFTGSPDTGERLFVVLFEDAASPAPKKKAAANGSRASKGAKPETRVPKLEHALAATKQYLEALIEEHDRTSDDLGSANEELVSGNEELQSLNEELETAKEELQSTNEELTTINDELHGRNQEVTRINSDLLNLIDTVDVPIVILDRERRIRRFTPQAQRVFNVLPADLGRPFRDIRPSVDVPDLDRQVADVIEQNVATESEVQDRSGAWYRMHIRPYRTIDDEIDGAIVSLLDIDALKHHINEARRASAEAEGANRAKDQFLATLSHELRSPLASMLLYAQFVRRGDLAGAELKQAGEGIERGLKLQVQLIDDLLDVSRIVAGKLRMEVRAVALAAVVEGAVAGTRAAADAKSLHVELALERSIVVAGDPTRLQQVVTNLLTNAVKFTSERGSVLVTLDTVSGRARLRVEDTGTGIEPGFLPQIFNRFTQEDSSSTRSYGGLGIGLAIVRHIVEAHGGAVSAESRGAGKGSTFTVTLPLVERRPDDLVSAPAPPPSIDAPVVTHEGALRGLKVLVVDDDEPTRRVLTRLLEKLGAEVTSAPSVAEALIAFEELRPDLLLSDVAMPNEDGYSLIRKVRARGAARGGDTPALALTALASAEDHRQALSAGFQMHLAKPVDIDAITKAVVALARRPG